MTITKKTSNPAPLAHRVPNEVSDLIATYSAWLEEQTGVKIDPMSVYLGSQLRGTFQKGEANQARLAQAAKDRAARDAAKAKAKAEREAAAAKKAAEPKAEQAIPKPAAKVVPTTKVPTKTPARRRPAKGTTAPVARAVEA